MNRVRVPSGQRPPMQLSASGRRDERGAVALEAALVAVLLATIVAGIVDVSLYFRASYDVTQGARAAARTASADPLGPTFASAAARQVANALSDVDPSRVTKIWVYKAVQATGQPVSPNCASTCVRYTLDAAGNPVAAGGSWSGRQACAAGQVDTVGVLVEYLYDAPITFLDGATISQRTVMRLEQVSNSGPCVSP